MPTIRLTDRSLQALTAEGKRVEYWDEVLRGFGVRVSETGSKTFVCRYRTGNKRRRVTVGRYPATSLADARARARETLGKAAAHEDPVAARQEEERNGLTFGELADLYLERHAKRNKAERSWREDLRQLNKDVLPAWRDRPASEIQRADVHEVLDAIAERGGVQANRTRALLSKVFNFGLERDLLDRNPVQGTSRPAKERPRERVLTNEEIRRLWRALDAESPLIAALYRLLLLTGQRGTEVKEMRHEDLEGDGWTIPGERFKSRRPHYVALSTSARGVLAEIRPLSEGSPFVFPSSRSRSGHLEELKNATRRIRKRAGLSFSAHDLRRTCGSNIAKLGVQRFVLGRVLGHADRSVTGVYDVHEYRDEKRDALERWANHLDAILAAEDSESTEPPVRPFVFRDGEGVVSVSSNVPLGSGSPILATRLLRGIGTPEERREAVKALHEAADRLGTALASIGNVESYPAAERERLRSAKHAATSTAGTFEELLQISERATDALGRDGLEFDPVAGRAFARTGESGRPALPHRELIAVIWRYEIAGRPGHAFSPDSPVGRQLARKNWPGEPEEIPPSGWYDAELLDRVAERARGAFGIPEEELTHAKIKSAVQEHHGVPGAIRSERQRRQTRS